MLRALLIATVFTGITGAAVHAQAAPLPADSLGYVHNEPLKAEKIYWARDAYGRPVWVPGRPYYPPPRYYRRRYWDGYHWRWR